MLTDRWRIVRWLAEFIDINTDKWANLDMGGERKAEKPRLEEWERMEKEERINLLKENDPKFRKKMYTEIEAPSSPNSDATLENPKERNTSRIKSSINLKLNQAEQYETQAELLCIQDEQNMEKTVPTKKVNTPINLKHLNKPNTPQINHHENHT